MKQFKVLKCKFRTEKSTTQLHLHVLKKENNPTKFIKPRIFRRQSKNTKLRDKISSTQSPRKFKASKSKKSQSWNKVSHILSRDESITAD